MSYFGKPRVFGEPLGLLRGGGGATFAQVLATLYARAGDVGMYYPLNEVSLSGGSVADNALYTDDPGSELLTDGGFEVWATATDLTHWTEVLAGSTTINQDSSDVHSGSFAARLDVDASNNGFGPTQGILLAKGNTIRARGWAKSDDPTTPRLQVGFVGGSTVSVDLTAAYVEYTARAIAHAANPTFLLQRGSNQANDSIWFDDWSAVLEGILDALISASGVTVNQTINGLKAFAFDGSAGVLTTYERASINGLTDFTWFARLVPDVVGTDDTLLFKNGEIDIYFNASGQLVAHVDYSTTDAESITDAAIPTSDTHLVVTLDSNDDTLRIYINGAEAAYGTQTAGEGTRVSNTNNLLWFKDGSTGGYDGLATRTGLIAAVATADEAQQLYAARDS